MIRIKDEKDNVFITGYRFIKKQKERGKVFIAKTRKMSKLIWILLTNDEDYDRNKMNGLDIIKVAL